MDKSKFTTVPGFNPGKSNGTLKRKTEPTNHRDVSRLIESSTPIGHPQWESDWFQLWNTECRLWHPEYTEPRADTPDQCIQRQDISTFSSMTCLLLRHVTNMTETFESFAPNWDSRGAIGFVWIKTRNYRELTLTNVTEFLVHYFFILFYIFYSYSIRQSEIIIAHNHYTKNPKANGYFRFESCRCAKSLDA